MITKRNKVGNPVFYFAILKYNLPSSTRRAQSPIFDFSSFIFGFLWKSCKKLLDRDCNPDRYRTLIYCSSFSLMLKILPNRQTGGGKHPFIVEPRTHNHILSTVHNTIQKKLQRYTVATGKVTRHAWISYWRIGRNRANAASERFFFKENERRRPTPTKSFSLSSFFAMFSLNFHEKNAWFLFRLLYLWDLGSVHAPMEWTGRPRIQVCISMCLLLTYLLTYLLVGLNDWLNSVGHNSYYFS